MKLAAASVSTYGSAPCADSSAKYATTPPSSVGTFVSRL
jgi:hypothetical protein